ncbi:MAG: GMP synthase [Bacteroidetes bacterium]|nr:GMP synthase [Bacteroidota bacterium]
MKKIKRVAVLDMNDNYPNQGMRGIRGILESFSTHLDYQVFDVRIHNEVPNHKFDIYIGSGGPGDPLKMKGNWVTRFYNLIDRLWANNQNPDNPRKNFFFICHSFQMACHHFGLGEISKRKSTSFGVFPVHKTEAGHSEPLLEKLPDPFYVVDSRDYQLVQPNLQVFEEHGATILSMEKIRTHIELERAIMAVRFSPEFFGVQFHPEADPSGMRTHFKKEENRKKVIKNYGAKKYRKMMDHLEDVDNIKMTHDVVLPTFLKNSLSEVFETIKV